MPPRKPFHKKKNTNFVPEEITRVKMPRAPEIFGLIEQRVGGSRMKVKCFDGKNRLCRIPGSKKRRLWVREGDLVIIKPWEFDGDNKGDVIFKYRPNQVDFLRKKGHLSKIEELDEF